MMHFKPIEVADYGILKPFFGEQPYPLSIYSPASIIAWSNNRHTASWAISGDTLYISGQQEGRPEDRHLILPLGLQCTQTPAELHRIAKDLGFERYWYVPGDFLDSLDREERERCFTIEEQLGYEDYVYLADDLIFLKGNRFHKKKNLIHQFSREYLIRNRVDVQPLRSADRDECLRFIDRWCERHPCEVDREQDLACEINAVTTTLSNLEVLESKGLAIRIDGEMVAFGIGSRLNDLTAVLNFEKALPDIKGLYQFLDNECAKRLFSGYRYINKEGDMSIASLAEAKRSYHPILRVKSFALTLR
jgi:hypothetical protein